MSPPCKGAAPPAEAVQPTAQLDVDLLYRAQHQALVRQVARRTQDQDRAADLVQDVFCRLVRLTRNLIAVERPAAYLQTAARNRMNDEARDSRVTGTICPLEDEELAASHDPVAMLESRDMLNRVEHALGKLRPRTREIFLAHRALGLSYAEIAERTGLSVKGVEKQMSKAIAELDRLMARHR